MKPLDSNKAIRYWRTNEHIHIIEKPCFENKLLNKGVSGSAHKSILMHNRYKNV